MPAQNPANTDSVVSTPEPLFSVVICVYNDWLPLIQCLESLRRQTTKSQFEVNVIDDGSQVPAPESIFHWDGSHPIHIIRQPHAGISAARNEGIRNARGSILLFVDADCVLEPNCLEVLATASREHAERNCFQLHLVGHCNGIVGRSEDLRLMTLQDHLLQTDGSIRYLNTAGFAIRRFRACVDPPLFEPAAARAEDTLLLANLMLSRELPLFVDAARVRHDVSLSLHECVLKEIRSARLEKATWDIIDRMGVRIRVSYKERLQMLKAMWKASAQKEIGHVAWIVLVGRQVLRLVVLLYAGIFDAVSKRF